MMPNDNIEAARQHQLVVVWIRLRQMKKLKKKQNQKVNLPHKNSKLLLMKILIIIKLIKMILTIKVIVIITIIITIKCRGRYWMHTKTNTELLVTLYNGRKTSSNTKKTYPSDAASASYLTLKWLMNRSRPSCLNSLLGTLPHLISQE